MEETFPPLLQDSDTESSASASSAPFRYSWAWSIPPSLGGATFVVIACLWPPFLTSAIEYRGVLRLLLGLFGLVVASAAYPICKMQALARSQAVRAMLDTAPAWKEEFDRQVGQTVYWSCGITAVKGVLYGVAFWWVFKDLLAAFLFGLAGGGVVFGSTAQHDLLRILFELCHESIDGFISANFPGFLDQGEEAGIDCEKKAFRSGRQKIDWCEVTRAHYSLDLRLENLWSSGLGAMFLGQYLARNFALGALLLVLSTVVQKPIPFKFVLAVVGASMLIANAVTLVRAASVTKRCNTEGAASAGKTTIGAAVNFETCRAQKTTEDEMVANSRFLQYLSHTHMGVEFFGVLMTSSFVLQVFIHLGTSLPIAVGILQTLLYKYS